MIASSGNLHDRKPSCRVSKASRDQVSRGTARSAPVPRSQGREELLDVVGFSGSFAARAGILDIGDDVSHLLVRVSASGRRVLPGTVGGHRTDVGALHLMRFGRGFREMGQRYRFLA